LESVLAGGYGDGGPQLRPDDNGARPSAGKRLAAAMAERTGFIGHGFQICCSNSAYLFVLLYSAFFYRF
jgi:hypothetical protein